MIDKRLINLLSPVKKYIVYHVLIRWFALMAQILAVFSLTGFMEKAMDDSYQRIDLYLTLAILAGTLVVRLAADRLSARVSCLAGSCVTRSIREQLYDKLMLLGSSYDNYATSSELVRLFTEGVEQLGIYFAKYLPQLFYSILAPITLLVILVFTDWTLAGALSILLLAVEFFMPLRYLRSYYPSAVKGMEAGERILALLDLPEREEGQGCWEENGAGIYMEDVCFSNEEGQAVLKDVSINLPAGSFVALVGEAGCGKSTISGFLTGKDRNYQGRILLGCREISEIAEVEIASHITRVGHDSYIFRGTVEENLRMAKPLATEDELLAVLTRVNLLPYLKGREGLSTRLEERGANLSPGQRQLLALARALLHDTPIYLFDETASGIDRKSENRIIWIINELAREKTVLLISDRLIHGIQSDCIYMMEHGQVAEKGTHRQLMQKDGAYRRLFMAQYETEQHGGGQEE
ncbi:MAG: ATP-binding cassette domain-containing protein [Roseburia sp.]